MVCLAIVLVAFLSCLVLGVSAFTYAIFWYETAQSSYRSYLDQLFHGKTGRTMLKAVLCSAFNLILTVVFYPLAAARKLWQPDPDRICPLPPVVLVHGLYHNASGWVLFRRHLRRAGFRNVYAFSYSSWKSSFPDLLEELDRQVVKVMGLMGGKSVVLIGHSLGGLLSRAYVECTDNAWKIDAVVTLGAPHQGSKMAVLGLGNLAHSLTYRGALISRLEKESRETKVPRLAVHSPLDNMVLPHEAHRVHHDGWEYRESYPTSHVGMLFRRPVANAVIEYLLGIVRKPGGTAV